MMAVDECKSIGVERTGDSMESHASDHYCRRLEGSEMGNGLRFVSKASEIWL